MRSKIDFPRPLLTILGLVLASLIMALAYPEGLNRVKRQPQFIGVVELAEKIKNRESFTLIDLRDSAEYHEFRIPSAIHVPLGEISAAHLEAPVIFYSGDDLLTRRLWDSLPDSLRDQTVIVYGGVRDWYSHLLYPTLPFGEVGGDSVLLERVHELCEFYGGYAEFEEDPSLMDYYKKDLSRVKWPAPSRSGALARKGC